MNAASDDIDIRLEPRSDGIQAACFEAMACPCEVLLETGDAVLAQAIGALAAAEAKRIERKFSRYRDDSVLAAINRGNGAPLRVDAETAALIDFAAQCHAMSEGRFDVTSGVLRRVWKFDGSDRVPSPAAVAALLPLIGFQRLTWQKPEITVPPGMELDFGGIGKEYAVDRVLSLIAARHDLALLVNFGGDLCANRTPTGAPWQIGVERPDTDRDTAMILELSQGALATSGDTRRYLLRDGVRYSHILDPATGWPVADAPRSITVAAATCVEAGMLATMALLRGADARRFLDEAAVRYWIAA
jgi:thiamine biosynthesis lipoprotein